MKEAKGIAIFRASVHFTFQFAMNTAQASSHFQTGCNSRHNYRRAVPNSRIRTLENSASLNTDDSPIKSRLSW